MLKTLCGAVAGAFLLAGPVQAAHVCAWMDETTGEDDYHELKLWLETDGDFDGYYMIKGEGFTSESVKAHSPNRGTFFLRPRNPDSLWGFGSTLSPPATIDVIVEIRGKPADVFSDELPPLLASFAFHRDVPEGETAPPRGFAVKQCATLGNPR